MLKEPVVLGVFYDCSDNNEQTLYAYVNLRVEYTTGTTYHWCNSHNTVGPDGITLPGVSLAPDAPLFSTILCLSSICANSACKAPVREINLPSKAQKCFGQRCRGICHGGTQAAITIRHSLCRREHKRVIVPHLLILSSSFIILLFFILANTKYSVFNGCRAD